MESQLTFAELALNPSVDAADEARLHEQCRRLYRRLCTKYHLVNDSDRWIKGIDLAIHKIDENETELTPQYNTRVWELRNWMEQWEPPWTIAVRHISGGSWEYALMRLSEAERRGVEPNRRPRVRQ